MGKGRLSTRASAASFILVALILGIVGCSQTPTQPIGAVSGVVDLDSTDGGLSLLSGSGDIYEPFSVVNDDWDEYDPHDRLELDFAGDQRLEFVDWKRYLPGHVSQPFRTQDFLLEYDINIENRWGNANLVMAGVSDNLGTYYEVQNGIFCCYYAGQRDRLYLITRRNQQHEWSWGTTSNSIRIEMTRTFYVRLEKSVDTVTLSVFLDAGRTVHASGSPVSVTTALTDHYFNYAYAAMAPQSFPPNENPEWTTGWIDNVYLHPVFQVLPVSIDIKPGSDPNSINLKSNGRVPVAILASTAFAVDSVNPGSVLFAGAAAVHSAIEDVNGDGSPDLILHFKTQELALTASSTEGVLTGALQNGTPITGSDTVSIVPGDK